MKYWTWKNKTTGEFESTIYGAPMLYKTQRDAKMDRFAPSGAKLVRVTIQEVPDK